MVSFTNNGGETKVSVTLIKEVVVTGENIFVFVFVDVVISSSAVDVLGLDGDGKLACVESEEILRLWVIGNGDDDIVDGLVELGVEKGFVGFVTGISAFNDLSSIENGKKTCAGEDFVNSVSSSAFNLNLISDVAVACVQQGEFVLVRSAVLGDGNDNSEKYKSIFLGVSLGTGSTSDGEFDLQRTMIVFGKSTEVMIF